MISFRVTKVRWDDYIIGVQGDVCINGNPAIPGQIITIKRDELLESSFNNAVLEKALELSEQIPPDIMSVFEQLDVMPCHISGKAPVVRADFQQETTTAPVEKETFVNSILRRLGR